MLIENRNQWIEKFIAAGGLFQAKNVFKTTT